MLKKIQPVLICPNKPHTTTFLRHHEHPPQHHPKLGAAIDYLVLTGWQTSWWVSILPRSPAARWQFPSSFSVEGCYFPVPIETEKEFHDYTCFRRNTSIKESFSMGTITFWKLIIISFLFSTSLIIQWISLNIHLVANLLSLAKKVAELYFWCLGEVELQCFYCGQKTM